MKITAAEIREKTFEKNFRGYDKDEVTHFLNALSKDWEALLEEKMKLELSLAASQAEANKLKQVEESLFRTLKTAEDTGASIIEEATQAADEIMNAAKENSEGMLSNAKKKADQMIAEAEFKSKQILENIKSDVTGLVRNYDQLIAQRETVLKNLNKLAEDIKDNITVSQETFKKVNLSVYEEIVENFAKQKTAIIYHDEAPKAVQEEVFVQEEKAVEVSLDLSPNDMHVDIKEDEPVEVKEAMEEKEEVQTVEESQPTMEAPIEEAVAEPEEIVSEEPKEAIKAEVEAPNPPIESPSDEAQKKKGGSFFDQFD